ncbi:hypothetical protein GRI89_03105 [Altererythrobacter salegens]|uniref:Uncharacterized protein n=1 Tax=Croceibacterium salegens TaxID=1737568 RepID=A0A6I4SRD2_9SPHN|nr:hypothetical protein [Croceibacterium salegens]MXO58531.1 hypothetical protein [Croceibacterium salegens]
MDWVAIVTVIVGLPTVFGAGVAAYRRHLTFKERQLELTAYRADEPATHYSAQVTRLEERVRVLERIATDKGADLAAQIEDLREETKTAQKAQEELN